MGGGEGERAMLSSPHSAIMPPRFQINSRYLLVTYSQADVIEHQELLDFLKTKYSDAFICVGRERHEDGGLHYHAFIGAEVPIRIGGARVLDLNNVHPNITSCRRPKEGLAYARKEGETMEWGNEPTFDAGIKWKDILASTTSTQAFMEAVREHYPRDFVLANERIQAYADKHLGRTPSLQYTPRYEIGSYTLPDSIQDWIDTELPKVRY